MNWNLDDICLKEKFGDLLKEIEAESGKLDEWWKKLSPEMEASVFKDYIEFDQDLSQKLARVLYLPELMEAINQKDAEARLMKGKAQDLWLVLAQKSRKFDHWLKGLAVEGKKNLDDDQAKRLFKAVPDLEYVFNYNRTAAKYTLEQREEEIIDNKDIYGQGVIADLRRLIETEMVYQMGKRKIKTQAELLKYTHSKNPKLRKEAYIALFNKQKENSDKLFVIYQSVVKDWAFETKIRGYKSPISVRNFGNHVSDKAVETLLRVCTEERKIYWRYFNYKAKSLGKNKLSRFDLFAPMKETKKKEYNFEESKKMVIKAYKQFDKNFADLAEKVFVEQHVDSLPKANKTSGAFCATVGPAVTPYIMLNHTGTARDVSTLAHELGHAIHSLMANKHYPSSQHANLPLSETASTLGEMILFEEMLSKETDKQIKKQMLWEKIADSYATILRQNYFVKFEMAAHELIAKGATNKDLDDLYLKNLREQFGSSMKIESIFKHEWMYISHIFESPFYCYAYNFGELLSLAIFAQYKKTGKTFIEKIKVVLAAGGSEDPTKVLSRIGVDIESEEFWRGGFKIIEGWQNELEMTEK
jgi:oligoendopeptidase F